MNKTFKTEKELIAAWPTLRNGERVNAIYHLEECQSKIKDRELIDLCLKSKSRHITRAVLLTARLSEDDFGVLFETADYKNPHGGLRKLLSHVPVGNKYIEPAILKYIECVYKSDAKDVYLSSGLYETRIGKSYLSSAASTTEFMGVMPKDLISDDFLIKLLDSGKPVYQRAALTWLSDCDFKKKENKFCLFDRLIKMLGSEKTIVAVQAAMLIRRLANNTNQEKQFLEKAGQHKSPRVRFQALLFSKFVLGYDFLWSFTKDKDPEISTLAMNYLVKDMPVENSKKIFDEIEISKKTIAFSLWALHFLKEEDTAECSLLVDELLLKNGTKLIEVIENLDEYNTTHQLRCFSTLERLSPQLVCIEENAEKILNLKNELSENITHINKDGVEVKKIEKETLPGYSILPRLITSKFSPEELRVFVEKKKLKQQFETVPKKSSKAL